MSRPETTIFGSLSSQPASEARSLGDFSRMSNPPPSGGGEWDPSQENLSWTARRKTSGCYWARKSRRPQLPKSWTSPVPPFTTSSRLARSCQTDEKGPLGTARPYVVFLQQSGRHPEIAKQLLRLCHYLCIIGLSCQFERDFEVLPCLVFEV